MSCVGDRYAGVDLRAGGAPTEVQVLARRARDGDKLAQFALGERYELGDGVERDSSRATALYKAAATDSGGTRTMFVPQRSGAVAPVPVDTGAAVKGLTKARAKLVESTALPAEETLDASATVSEMVSGKFKRDRLDVPLIAPSMQWLIPEADSELPCIQPEKSIVSGPLFTFNSAGLITNWLCLNRRKNIKDLRRAANRGVVDAKYILVMYSFKEVEKICEADRRRLQRLAAGGHLVSRVTMGFLQERCGQDLPALRNYQAAYEGGAFFLKGSIDRVLARLIVIH